MGRDICALREREIYVRNGKKKEHARASRQRRVDLKMAGLKTSSPALPKEGRGERKLHRGGQRGGKRKGNRAVRRKKGKAAGGKHEGYVIISFVEKRRGLSHQALAREENIVRGVKG